MYELKKHKNLSLEKWSKFPPDQQIIMIANEVQRLLTCIKENIGFDAERERIECALELIDLTINCGNQSLRRELLRFRDLFAALYLMNEQELEVSYEFIKKLLRVLLQMNSKSILILEG